jgi:hypothetical protein
MATKIFADRARPHPGPSSTPAVTNFGVSNWWRKDSLSMTLNY